MTIKFTSDLSNLSDKIEVNFNEIGGEKSKRYKVTRSSSVLFNPEEFNIRYTGALAGGEGSSFIETIIMVSNRESGLSPQQKKILSNLNEKRRIQIFVTPACPYCPGHVINANGRTNIPRIYAAGDVTGGVRQIVTAVSEGATAALSAFEDIKNPYWKRSGKQL